MLTRPVRQRGWLRAAMASQQQKLPVASDLRADSCRFGGTAVSSSQGSVARRVSSPDYAWTQRLSLLSRLGRDDQGAVAVLAALLIGGLVALSLCGVHLGAAVLARHRAQSAADLAVLAAAGWLPAGREAACHGAGRVSGAMGAVVRGCDIDDLDIVVTVTVALGGWVGSEAQASARAGPMH